MKRLIDANALRDIWLCLEGNDFKASDFVYSIDAQPTIDAEPVRHGKWIYIYKKVPVFNYQCSECGARSILFENFCSYCGARMDAE